MAHLAWSWPCEESSWGSSASLCDAGITQPINKLFAQESHVICRSRESVQHNRITDRFSSLFKLLTLAVLENSLLPSVRHSGLCVRTLLRTGRICVSEWPGASDCRLSRVRRRRAQSEDRSALDAACWSLHFARETVFWSWVHNYKQKTTLQFAESVWVYVFVFSLQKCNFLLQLFPDCL